MEDSMKSFCSTSSDEEISQVDVQPSTSKEKQGWLEMASEKFKKAKNMFKEKSRTDFKSKMWGTWNSLKYSDKWQMDQSRDYDQEGTIWLLGRGYTPEGEDQDLFTPDYGSSKRPNHLPFYDFVRDYYSRIWITYRTGFSAFEGTQITTDCGWGCMLRSAQMMTAQAICNGRLSRNWRFRGRKPSVLERFDEKTVPAVPESGHSFDEEHFSIIKLFEDSPDAPLGIHRLVNLARESKKIEAVGRWYSASEAVSLLKKAISASPLGTEMAVLLCVDGHLKMTEAELLSRNWTKSLFIVVTIRMGTTEINPVYYNHIQQLFSLDTCLGMLGGRPDHSLYFIGAYNREIVYLDPHVAHQYIPLPKEVSEEHTGTKHPLSSFHCKKLSKMPFSEMDPSCAVGFFVRNKKELDDTVKMLNLHQVIDVSLDEGEGEKRTRDPIFAVVHGEGNSPTGNIREATQEEMNIAQEHGFELL